MSDAVVVALISVGLPLAGVIYAKISDKVMNTRQVKLSEMENFYKELIAQLESERSLKTTSNQYNRSLEKQLVRCFRIFRGVEAEVRVLNHLIQEMASEKDPSMFESNVRQVERVIAKLGVLIKESAEIEEGEITRIGEPLLVPDQKGTGGN